MIENEAPQAEQPDPAAGPVIAREEPGEVPEARQAHVKKWVSLVRESKSHWEKKFGQMRRDMAFARGVQWEGQAQDGDEDKYIVNVTQRHIRQRVASLYAKDPTVIARARPQLDFELWDESPQSATMAMQALAAVNGDPGALAMMNPAAAELLADIANGMQQRQLRARTAKTLEALFRQQIAEQVPPFKRSMKQHVRRTLVCSVGYVKLGFQRLMEPRPEDAEKIRDITEQIANAKRLSADIADGEVSQTAPEVSELEQQLKLLQEQPQVVVKEGLIFDFPPSTSIIVDKRCRQLDGFVGARFVAQEFMLTPEEVRQTYGVDLKAYTRYSETGARTDYSGLAGQKDTGLCCLWVVYSKTDGLVYVVVDGYPDFIREPEPPEVKLERFWPIFPLTFNALEDESNPFPKSDVELIKPMQLEMNRARQGLREHRIAARPGWFASAAAGITAEDKTNLRDSPAHALVELQGMQPGDKIENILQPKNYPGVDPNLYDTTFLVDDVNRSLGMQEANIGMATGGATATETAVAESSRSAGIASEVDDLDDHLSEIARAAGEVLLREFDAETVRKLVGPGAVWPEQLVEEYIDTIALEVRAGSSGRPNKAAEIQNFERLAPVLVQIPGISPEWLARQAIERLEDRADLTDAYAASLPSIAMMNTGKMLGNGATGAEGAAQGPQGSQNTEQAPAPSGPAPNGDAIVSA